MWGAEASEGYSSQKRPLPVMCTEKPRGDGSPILSKEQSVGPRFMCGPWLAAVGNSALFLPPH